MALRWLLIQYGFFKLAVKSAKEDRWKILYSIVSYYLQNLGFSVTPLPFFAESYFASGSFTYYRGLSLRLEREYYVIAVDYSDPLLLWPLVFHEIGHCWLSVRDDIDRICKQSIDRIRSDISPKTVHRKLEETLCDVIATYLIGPSYPYAFLAKLWALFYGAPHPDYPSNSFRLECMARTLDSLGLSDLGNELRKTRDEKFNESWEDEDIAPLVDDIFTVTSNLPRFVSRNVLTQAKNIIKVSKTSNDLPAIFLFPWLIIDEVEHDNIDTQLRRASNLLYILLERWSKSSNSTA